MAETLRALASSSESTSTFVFNGADTDTRGSFCLALALSKTFSA